MVQDELMDAWKGDERAVAAGIPGRSWRAGGLSLPDGQTDTLRERGHEEGRRRPATDQAGYSISAICPFVCLWDTGFRTFHSSVGCLAG